MSSPQNANASAAATSKDPGRPPFFKRRMGHGTVGGFVLSIGVIVVVLVVGLLLLLY